jgi:multiple sugar transport system substrate-binding protein
MASLIKGLLALLCFTAIAVWLLLPAATVTPDGVTQISFGSFGNPEQVDVYKHIVNLFEQSHPSIRVDLRTPSSGGYLEKLKTEMAGRVAPDVTWIDVGSFYSFSDKAVFRPLTEFIQGDLNCHLEDFFSGMIDALKYQGEVYALPKSCGSLILFYNQDHFDQAGIPYPDRTWTWETVIEVSKKLSRDLDGDGRMDRYALVLTNPLDLMWQYGVEVLSPDGLRCTLDTPEAHQACQLSRDLVYVHHAAPTNSEMGAFGLSAGGTSSGGRGGQGSGVYDLFPMERASMIITDLVLSIAYQKARFRWDVAVQPGGTRHGGYLNGAGYAMNSRTQHPQEAWELIKFLSGPEVQRLRAKGGDSLPSMLKIARSEDFLGNPKPPHNREALIEQAENAAAPPYHPRWPTILQEVSLMMEGIMAEEDPVPVEMALKETVRKINLILSGED